MGKEGFDDRWVLCYKNVSDSLEEPKHASFQEKIKLLFSEHECPQRTQEYISGKLKAEL
jgi:hypothetical protein